MKKITMIIMMALVVILAGCNGLSNEKEKEKENLSLQVLKTDAEAGVTLENHEVYKGLNQLISEVPDIGLANDFSVYIVDILDAGTKDASILFLGINRLKDPIKDVSFDYTFGHENGKFVFKDVEVNLSEKEAGIIQANHAVPFTLKISAEEEALLDTINEENQVVEISNDSFDYVK